MVKFSVTPGRSFDFASLKLPSADVRVCRKTNGRQHKRQGVQLLLQLELCSCRGDFVRGGWLVIRSRYIGPSPTQHYRSGATAPPSSTPTARARARGGLPLTETATSPRARRPPYLHRPACFDSTRRRPRHARPSRTRPK